MVLAGLWCFIWHMKNNTINAMHKMGYAKQKHYKSVQWGNFRQNLLLPIAINNLTYTLLFYVCTTEEFVQYIFKDLSHIKSLLNKTKKDYKGRNIAAKGLNRRFGLMCTSILLLGPNYPFMKLLSVFPIIGNKRRKCNSLEHHAVFCQISDYPKQLKHCQNWFSIL